MFKKFNIYIFVVFISLIVSASCLLVLSNMRESQEIKFVTIDLAKLNKELIIYLSTNIENENEEEIEAITNDYMAKLDNIIKSLKEQHNIVFLNSKIVIYGLEDMTEDIKNLLIKTKL